MSDDPGWIRRHIQLMRTQRGHWCFIEGCTGSQPLMWVPTAREVWAERQPRGRAIDLPLRLPPYRRRHISGTMPPSTAYGKGTQAGARPSPTVRVLPSWTPGCESCGAHRGAGCWEFCPDRHRRF